MVHGLLSSGRRHNPLLSPCGPYAFDHDQCWRDLRICTASWEMSLRSASRRCSDFSTSRQRIVYGSVTAFPYGSWPCSSVTMASVFSVDAGIGDKRISDHPRVNETCGTKHTERNTANGDPVYLHLVCVLVDRQVAQPEGAGQGYPAFEVPAIRQILRDLASRRFSRSPAGTAVSVEKPAARIRNNVESRLPGCWPFPALVIVSPPGLPCLHTWSVVLRIRRMP